MFCKNVFSIAVEIADNSTFPFDYVPSFAKATEGRQGKLGRDDNIERLYYVEKTCYIAAVSFCFIWV